MIASTFSFCSLAVTSSGAGLIRIQLVKRRYDPTSSIRQVVNDINSNCYCPARN